MMDRGDGDKKSGDLSIVLVSEPDGQEETELEGSEMTLTRGEMRMDVLEKRVTEVRWPLFAAGKLF
jgi:hypothetical protein